MIRPIYTVHCKVKKHHNLIRLLHKSVNKKYGLKVHQNVDDTHNHVLILSSTHDSSAKHYLHRPRPYFTGICIIYIYHLIYKYN